MTWRQRRRMADTVAHDCCPLCAEILMFGADDARGRGLRDLERWMVE